MDDIPRMEDYKDHGGWVEFVEDLVDECAAAIERDGGDGQHHPEFLAREIVEDHVFGHGPSRALFILVNSPYELGEWEPYTGPQSPDYGADNTPAEPSYRDIIEAMAYSKLRQEVYHDLREEGYDL